MDIILFIIGVFLIWQGKMKISKNKVLEGKAARIIGVISLIPAIISFSLVYFSLIPKNGVSGLIVWPVILIVLVSIIVCSKNISSGSQSN